MVKSNWRSKKDSNGKVKRFQIRTVKYQYCPSPQAVMLFPLNDKKTASIMSETAVNQFKAYLASGDIEKARKLKRAIVSAGNKSEAAGNSDIALLYRKSHQNMLLPDKDGLIYAYDANGKRVKRDYDAMSLTDLKNEAEYYQKLGLTGEVAKINKVLIKRAKEREKVSNKIDIPSQVIDKMSEKELTKAISESKHGDKYTDKTWIEMRKRLSQLQPLPKVTEIIINRVEGPAHLVNKPIKFSSIEEANRYLSRNSYTVDGHYDKHDFVIKFSNGDGYEGRYDLRKNENADIAKHVIGYAKAIQKFDRITPEEKEAYRKIQKVMEREQIQQ